MKRFARLALAAGVPFGAGMGAAAWVYYGRTIALVVAVATGLAFGVSMAALVAMTAARRGRSVADLDGESLLHEGPANRFVGWQVVGGWLCLTNARLVFRPHALNLHREEWRLALAEISRTELVRTLGLVPNGLVVETTSGARERFVVEDRRRWNAVIEAARAARRADA